jgi:hypothetical protein
MAAFSLPMGIPRRGYTSIPAELASRMGKNHDFFVKHEMLPFSNYKPDVEAIRASGVRMFMAAGKTTLEKHKFYGETALILADLLECEMVQFPGHHLSYIDMAEEWADILRLVLYQAS